MSNARAEQNNRMETLETALRRIEQWCDAYPIEAFPEPDLESFRQLLGNGPFSGLHAAWARHLLSGIGKIAKEAL